MSMEMKEEDSRLLPKLESHPLSQLRVVYGTEIPFSHVLMSHLQGSQKTIRLLADYDRFPIAIEIPIVLAANNRLIASRSNRGSVN